MKKFGKIFALLLALCVLVGVFIVVASADGEKNTTDPFIVNGTYYSNYYAAFTAAGGTKVIYMNPDYIDPDTGEVGVYDFEVQYVGGKPENTQFYSWNKNVTIDLNGCTIRTSGKAPLIAVSTTCVFTMRGEGTLDNIYLLLQNSGADVHFIGTGKGITINLRDYEVENPDLDTHSELEAANTNVFNMAGDAAKPEQHEGSLNLEGRITINPYNVHANNASNKYYAIFNIGGVNSKFNAKNAKVTVNIPKSEMQKEIISGKKADAGYMFKLGVGSTVNIENSSFVYNHGNMFKINATGTPLTFVQNADGSIASGDPGLQKAQDPTVVINAKNSTFIANEGYYINRTDYDHAYNYYSAGYLIQAGSAPLYAEFDKCNFRGAHRAFLAEGRSTETASCIASAHLIMTDCNYETDDSILQASPWLVGESINVRWTGGYINLKKPVLDLDPNNSKIIKTVTLTNSSDVCNYTHPYAALADNGNDYDDDWYGVGFKNVIFHHKPNDSNNAIGKGAYKNLGTVAGPITYYNNGDSIDSGSHYWFGEAAYAGANNAPAYYSLTGVVANRTTNIDGTSNYTYGSTAGNSYGSFFPSTNSPKRSGIFERVNDGENGYARFIYKNTEEAPKGAEGYPYLDINMTGTAGVSNKNPKTKDDLLAVTVSDAKDSKNMKYLLLEFDIATTTETYTSTSIGPSNRVAEVTYDSDKQNYVINPTKHNNGEAYATLKPDGTFTAGGESAKLPTDGSWSRISIIFEIVYKSTKTTIDGDPTGSEYDAYEFSGTKAHIYLNGKKMATVAAMGNAPTLAHLISTFTIDAVRLNFTPVLGVESDVAVDNLLFAKYKSSYTDECATIANIISSGSNLNGVEGFLSMPSNNTKDYAAKVDGVKYEDIDEAIEAIDHNSDVTLYKDVDKIVAVDKLFIVNTNGHSIKGYSSSKFVAMAGDGYLGFRYANDEEKYKVHLVNEDLSINETLNLTLGSSLTASGAADPNSYTELLSNGKFFGAWSLADGTNATIVSPAYDTDGNNEITAYPVYVDPAIVEWYDNNKVLLGSESYKPGDGVFSKVFEPETALPGITTSHAWFDYSYAGYAAVSLPTSGTYKVYPTMKPVAKDGMPTNIKLNLTLFTNNELNIFVPLDVLSEYKDSIRIVRLDGETNTIAVGSRGECTVYSAPYLKFADVYGIADTSINTYRIYYNVGGVELSKDIKYGVPAYASQIMQTSNNEEAKTLVMNMVNYANAIIKNLNVDKTGDLGARVYTKLLELYPDYVRTYDDDEFLEGGTIYNNDVAKLTFDDVIADNPETEEDESLKSPSKWIAKGGFFFSTNQPRFYIVFSEDAEATVNGIKKPSNSSGYYGYSGTGMFVYIGMENESPRPGKLYARFDDGSEAYGSWNADQNQESVGNITYYTAATMFDSQNPFKLYNMAENLRIVIYNTDGANTPKETYAGNGVNATYSLAGYINGMLTAADAEGVSEADKAEYLAGAEMAKALYAYAKVTREYVY